jgi:hypothetical protein
VQQVDSDNIYPAKGTVTDDSAAPVNSNDLKYYPLLALSTDIKLSE